MGSTMLGDDWSPEASDQFLKCLVVAMHCVRNHFHCLRVEKSEGLDALMTLCAVNCPGHFEIVLREPVKVEDVTPDTFNAHIVNMIEAVHKGGNVLNFYSDGMELRTAEATYMVMAV